MYWYLSFLRPPPVSVSLSSGEITITPQIANDLRTELHYEPADITYVWQRVSPTTGKISKQRALTTWSPPASTYRAITIPLPEFAKVGEKWRLGLFSNQDSNAAESSSASSSSSRTDLLDYTGPSPGTLSVWSEGIAFVRGELSSSGPVRGIGAGTAEGKGGKSTVNQKENKKGKGKSKEEEGPKQGRIVREWRLSEGELVMVEQTSFDLDKKIWDSGLALSSWFLRYLDGRHTHQLAEKVLGKFREEEGKLRILELGSGTGLVSIAMALSLKQWKEERRVRTSITATDLDSAIALMNENVLLNGLSRSGASTSSSEHPARLDVKVLDWDQPLPSWITPDTWPDLIVAADVTYNTSSFPSLLSTLISLLDASQRPRLLLAYKQRDPGERHLWDMLKSKGVGMELVDTIRGSEEEGQVEIWVGQMQR